MAGILNTISMFIGSIGLFFGFYYLSSNLIRAIEIVTFTTVGIVGSLAFVRHVVFYKSDAKRLGWETDRPDWIFEVGFANLAFGIIGLLSSFQNQGTRIQAIVLLDYALYLLQAAALHGIRYFTDGRKSPARLWRSFIATFLYAGMMGFFALGALFH